MAASKLFTPALLYKRPGNVLQAQESDDCFVNPPNHAEIPVFEGATDQGPYPLRMSKGSNQAYAERPQHRKWLSRSDRGDF